MRKVKERSSYSQVDTARTYIGLDLEWDRSDHFRCGVVYHAGKLLGFQDVSQLIKFLKSLPGRVCFVGHNLSADLRRLVKYGYLPPDFEVKDSLIAARLVDTGMVDKSLKILSREYGFEYEDLHSTQDLRELMEYAGKDVWASWWLYRAYEERVKNTHQEKVLDWYNKFVVVYFLLEIAGLRYDYLLAREEIEKYKLELSTLLGSFPLGLDPKTITNDNLLREWLKTKWSEKDLAVLGKTASGLVSVGSEQLRLLPRQPKGFEAILKARSIQDFLSLYLFRPLSLLDGSGFLSPSYRLLVAKTHRRSTYPAIQNWPKEARRYIISRFPGGRILAADFKNLEARLFAWQSGCRKFFTAMIERGYSGVAEEVFKLKKVEKGTAEYTFVKSTVLAVLYNMSANLLAKRLRISLGRVVSVEEAEKTLSVFYETYPEVWDAQQKRKMWAWKYGRTYSDVGAEIPLHLLPREWYRDDYRRKEVENKAVNYPTQQLASYVTAFGLYSLQKDIADRYGGFGQYCQAVWESRQGKEVKGGILPIIEVHDEVVFDTDTTGREEEYVEWIKWHLTEGGVKYLRELCPKFSCPLEVEVVGGDFWVK